MAQALERREVELQAALKLVQEQAIHDPLTGLYNRRQMEELLSREFLRAQRSGSMFAVVMVDIDHFKRINDTHGHETGDEVLARIATVLGNGIRRSDIACRYGGEEFLLLLLGSSAENAVRRATEIRHSLRNLVLSLRGGATLSITASFGVAACPEHGTDRDALLRAADQALYRAKNSGRDQVVAAEVA
jgi:diguanylate cyclase (GGDEF)-like protein